MITLEPSLLSADVTRLGEQAREAQDAGADALHVDVMDGRFVPNITFGANVVQGIRRVVSLPLHVHLMIMEPEKHLETFAEAGATTVTVHAEASPHLHRTLGQIRALGMRAGVALNPSTPASAVEEVLDLTDMLLVMTVNPGWGGQAFIASQLDKIRRLRMLLSARGLPADIGVDGGIDARTAPLVVQAGANVLAAGSSVYNDRPLAANLAALRAALNG